MNLKKLTIGEKILISIYYVEDQFEHKINKIFDYLNTPKNAIIKKKNPREYLDKLIFHKKIKKFSEYLK